MRKLFLSLVMVLSTYAAFAQADVQPQEKNLEYQEVEVKPTFQDGDARRLELRQNETYGTDPKFQAYIKKTPLILPLVPFYSVAKYEGLKG